MAQSSVSRDFQAFQGTASTTGGTFVANYPVPTDKLCYLRATAICTAASASHLASGCAIGAEYVVENKNGTLAPPAPFTGAGNPMGNTSTTFVASRAQGSDYNATGTLTLVWSISGTNAVCTLTNVGNTVTVNVTIVVEAILVGST